MTVSKLNSEAKRLDAVDLRTLVDNGVGRSERSLLKVCGLELDSSKQRLDADAWTALFAHAESLNLSARIQALLSGEIVNATEGRPALHPAYRQGALSPDLKLRR